MNRDQMSEIRDQWPATSSSSSFEETLRLLAHLSAPEGLEERVQAGLRAAPRAASGKARVLRWPMTPRLENAWMRSSLVRSAAAAAIVTVVVGGGWGVYSRVQPTQPARATTMPLHVSAPGGFSSAGAMRTPQTLNRPVVEHPEAAAPQTAKTAGKLAVKTPVHSGKTTTASKATAQSAAVPAK